MIIKKSRVLSYFIYIILVFLIMCMGNYLGQKYDKNFDVTQAKQNSISSEVKALAQKIDKKIKVYILTNKKEWRTYADFFSLFDNDYNLELNFIDPDKNYLEAKKHNVSSTPAFVFYSKGKRRILYDSIDEQDFSKVIKSFLEMKNSQLCFFEGHSEIDLLSNEKKGGSNLFKNLKDLGFRLKVVRNVEDQCDVYLILGAKYLFTKKEVEELKNSKKKIFLALNPNEKEPNLELRSIFKQDGVVLQNDVIVDAKLSKDSGDATILDFYRSDHKSFSGAIKSVVRLNALSSIAIKNKSFSVLKTSSFPDSWGIQNFNKFDNDVEFRKEDAKGPLDIAVAIEQEKFRKGVVVSNAGFLTNQFSNFKGNTLFFLNLLDWLRGEDLLVESRAMIEEKIQLNPSSAKFLGWWNLVIFPLLSILFSWFLWKRRRS